MDEIYLAGWVVRSFEFDSEVNILRGTCPLARILPIIHARKHMHTISEI